MKTSAIKFVSLFVVFAIVFLVSTVFLLGQPAESLFSTSTQAGWQSAVSIILSPIKMILMGPLLPYIDFMRQDPDTPPPFVLAGFVLYWALLGLAIRYLVGMIKRG